LLCVVVGAVFVVFVLSLVLPLLDFDAQGRHSSKTVTIVMMSAAPEQKKRQAQRQKRRKKKTSCSFLMLYAQ